MNELNITSEFGLTEEQLEDMTAKYENDTWTGEVTEPRRGRPYEFDEDQLNASSQLPETNSDKVCSILKANRRRVSTSVHMFV